MTVALFSLLLIAQFSRGFSHRLIGLETVEIFHGLIYVFCRKFT